MTEKADYGIDAPGVVRRLSLAAVLGLATFGSIAAGLWSGTLRIGGLGSNVTPMSLMVGASCALMAGYMVWSSKVGKLRERNELLSSIVWTGQERVLDVGCGRGLLLVGAARRGREATGLDLWQAEDLAGNRPEATLENARREGVADRVRVETGDMRKMPFADASFDVVVSMTAIHNIYDAAGRRQAIGEIARVVAPGGHVLVDDIRHLDEYEAELRARGFQEVRRLHGGFGGLLLAVMTFGSLRPGRLVAKK